MNLKLLSAVLVSGLMHSASLLALGLGPISVNSSLSEAFDADIPISNSAGLSSAQILVKLASQADFDRAGVERSYFLTNLEFTVEKSLDGDGYTLHVVSEENVNEPYINFLVEARWPHGRLLREYTVLLDLPQYSGIAKKTTAPLTPTGSDKPSKSSSGVNKSNDTTLSIRPAQKSAASASSSARVSASGFTPDPSVAGKRQTVLVEANDTLSQIANKVKPAGVPSHKMMLAIVALNPDAFINNDINLLKKGAVLNIPAASELNASADSAQKNSLKQLATEKTEPSARTLDARSSTFQRPVEKAENDAHLKLTTAQQADQPAAAVNARSSQNTGTLSRDSEQLSQEVEQLRNELAISLENLDKASVENSDLVNRLEGLEAQLSDLETLITLKDKELNAIRNNFEQAQQEAQLAQAAAAQDTAQAAGAELSAVADNANAELVMADSSETNAVTDKPAEQPASGQQPLPAQGVLASLADRLSVSVDYLLLAIVVVLVLLLGVISWLFTRKKASYSSVAYEPTVFADEKSFAPESEIATAAELEEEQIDDGVEEEGANQFYGDEESPEEDAGPRVGDVARSFDEMDEVDVLAEADIYLAYGKHDQCIKLLSDAIANESGRTDYRLKLLEVFVDANRAGEFKQACSELIALGDDAASIEAEGLLHGKTDLNQWWPDEAISDTTANQDISQAYANESAQSNEESADLSLDSDAIEEPQASSPTLVFDAEEQSKDDFADLGSDIIATKLDLARAYIDMGDYDGAREILDEVKQEGSSEQQQQADEMLAKIA